LGGNADLGARGAAIFRRVIRSKNLDFLRGVHVSHTNTGTVGTRASGRSAIKSDQIFGVSGAVEIRRSLAQTEGKIRGGGGTGAWNQGCKTDRVAAIELEQIYLLSRDELLHCRRFRLYQRSSRLNYDGFCSGAHRERRVDRQTSARVQLVICRVVLLKTRCLGTHVIEARRDVGYGVKS